MKLSFTYRSIKAVGKSTGERYGDKLGTLGRKRNADRKRYAEKKAAKCPCGQACETGKHFG